MLALRVFRAIHASASQQASEIGGADAEHLLSQDVIDTMFEVWDLVFEALGEAARDLTEEHTRFRARIKET